MVTIRQLLAVTLQEHQKLNLGELHGPSSCSVCQLLVVLMLVANTVGVLESEVVPVVAPIGA